MKRARILIMVLLMFSLTGCIKKYNYTEEQSDSAAEYMAGKLLESDSNYEQDLLPMEEVTEKVSPTVSVTPTPSTPAENTDSAANSTESGTKTTASNKEYTLSEVIDTKNFDLKYTGYVITDSYPEDSTETYFTVSPRQGNQLAVISFALKNKTDKKKTLNLTKADIQFKLDINAGELYGPSLSLIENDLQYIDISLKGGEEKPVLLIFEIKKDSNITDINLTVSQGDKSANIVIK